jgi:hypothetical protein
MSKLSQQLAKEMKRNPKKAVLLGLLAAVAGWFWLPLVTGSAETEIADAALPPAAPPIVKTTEQKPPTAVTQASWQQLLQWMEGDPRLRPADKTPSARDPFAVTRSQEEKQGSAVTAADKAPAKPDECGLKLTGVLVGTRRMATISGRTYREGQVIPAKDDVSYVVEKITAKGVVLRRDAQTYELKMPAASSDAVEITKSGE